MGRSLGGHFSGFAGRRDACFAFEAIQEKEHFLRSLKIEAGQLPRESCARMFLGADYFLPYNRSKLRYRRFKVISAGHALSPHIQN